MILGLTQAEAEKRLNEDGFNELPSEKKRNFFMIFWKVIQEPMLLLLLGCGLIYLLLGEPQDTIVLSSCIFVVIGITFFQERKTERALETLKLLADPKAFVLRDGEERRIPGREVVVGDILILQEGDRIPADAVMIACVNLAVDESMLTGESLAVSKSQWDGKSESGRPGGENQPFIYSGTLIVSGRGTARVTATGVSTEMGKIGKALQTIRNEEPLIKKEVFRIVRIFGVAGFVLCAAVVILYGLQSQNWLQGFLAGLTLSMSMLPEEFPVVLIIFFALGAWRISKHRVLARNTAAIETLGAATVLGVDKTGTLTQNLMELKALYVDGESFELSGRAGELLPERFGDLLEAAVLASRVDSFDQLEKEIGRQGKRLSGIDFNAVNGRTLVKEYPFTKEMMAFAQVWESHKSADCLAAVKGAPEAIIDLCHLDADRRESLEAGIKDLAASGFRILGVARACHEPADLPDGIHDFAFEFLGLIAFVDPVRKTVAPALREAYAAGVRVLMITGDYPGTAQYVARQIGLRDPDKFLTGPEIEKLSLSELKEKIRHINIFARVVPEQKLAIIQALKANGEIVAMTGDGINDAPALKAAHIGIAMGGRGTDVAREASDLILLNDDFASIILAIREGRKIYGNLKKAMAYISSVHVPIAGLAVLPALFGYPLLLLPVHIAFLELIIDPACSVVFEAEPEESDVMRRPPRRLHDRLFNGKTFFISFLQGLSVLVASFSIFLFYSSAGEDTARTAAFTALIVGNIMLIIVNISWSKNCFMILRTATPVLASIVSFVAAAVILILAWPAARSLFHFTSLKPMDLLIVFSAGVLSVSWFEILKLVRRKDGSNILEA